MINIEKNNEITNLIADIEQKLKNEWNEVSNIFPDPKVSDTIDHIKSYISQSVTTVNFQKIAIDVGVGLLAAVVHKLIFRNKNHSYTFKIMMIFIEMFLINEVKNTILKKIKLLNS